MAVPVLRDVSPSKLDSVALHSPEPGRLLPSFHPSSPSSNAATISGLIIIILLLIVAFLCEKPGVHAAVGRGGRRLLLVPRILLERHLLTGG